MPIFENCGKRQGIIIQFHAGPTLCYYATGGGAAISFSWILIMFDGYIIMDLFKHNAPMHFWSYNPNTLHYYEMGSIYHCSKLIWWIWVVFFLYSPILRAEYA